MKRARNGAGENPKPQSRLAKAALESISSGLLNRDAFAHPVRSICAQQDAT
jgi:hypothetical protein